MTSALASPEYRRRAVVLFSGGLSSTTCLAWAVDAFGADAVHPLSFAYGQRHSVELDCATRITRLLGLRDTEVLPMALLHRLGGDALTDDRVALSSADNRFAAAKGLPSTFVPGRGLLFAAGAAAFAARHGARDIVIGECGADAAGLPEARAEFVSATQAALRAAFDEPFVLHAPLIEKTKAEAFALAERLGRLELVVGETHSCHVGAHTVDDRHPWGYGCGMCLACSERASGWHRYRAAAEAAA